MCVCVCVCVSVCACVCLTKQAIRDDVEHAGAKYVEGQSVVVDANLVTSRVPDDLPDFCKALIAGMMARA